MGLEPTNRGATNLRLNHLATTAVVSKYSINHLNAKGVDCPDSAKICLTLIP